MQPVVKLQLLVRPVDRSLSHEQLARLTLRELVPRIEAQHPSQLALYVAEPPPRLSLVPFRRTPIVLVTLTERSSRGGGALHAPVETEQLEPWFTVAAAVGLRIEAYRVSSTSPVVADRSWPLGERTPGVGLLTLLRRNPRISSARLMAEWHGKHTPMSLVMHPLWHYERNVVLGPVAGACGPWDGIVTEHFRERADLLRPWRLFGGVLRALPNMIRVGLHIGQFLDMRSLETYLVSERRLRD